VHLNKDDIEWDKVFIYMYIVVAIIVIIIIWMPEKKYEISEYTQLKIEDVDKMASEEYINSFINCINKNEVELLYNNLSYSYIAYNKLNLEKFEQIFTSEFNSLSNIYISNVEKIEYGNNIIYRSLLNGEKNINIIEEDNKEWTFTFDDFYNFNITNFSNEYKNIKFTIDSIYQTFDYIEVTCYIENNTSDLLDIHFEQEDSIFLKLDSGDIIEISNSQIDQNLSKVNKNTVSNRTFRFNIDLTNQAKITQIVFNNLEINKNKGNMAINLNV